jgi:hypothetical protein
MVRLTGKRDIHLPNKKRGYDGSVDYDRVHTMMNASYSSRSRDIRAMEAYGYQYDTKLSNKKTKVYASTNPDQNPLVLFRGSVNKNDVWTDLQLGLGLGARTQRAKVAKQTLKHVQEQYKTKKVDVAGHSLGGFLADHANTKGGSVTTYNKPFASRDRHHSKQIDFRSTGDLVSLFPSRHNHSITIDSGTRNPLKAHSYDFLKRHSSSFL